MRKLILIFFDYEKENVFLAVAVCAAGAYFAVNANSGKVPATDLMMQNIEALAQGEGSGGLVYCSGGDRKCADVYDKAGNCGKNG